MHKVNPEAVESSLRQGSPPHSAPQQSAMLSDPSSPIWELWQRMGEVYGHQWASQQGDEPNDTWARGLEGLTPQQFAHGMNSLFTRKETWPPNLVEFRQLCTGEDGIGWERSAHRKFDVPALESDSHKAKRAETARQGMAGVWAAYREVRA